MEKTVLYHSAAASNFKASEREKGVMKLRPTDCVTPREIIKEHFAAEDLVERSECEERSEEKGTFVSFDRRRHIHRRSRNNPFFPFVLSVMPRPRPLI